MADRRRRIVESPDAAALVDDSCDEIIETFDESRGQTVFHDAVYQTLTWSRNACLCHGKPFSQRPL